MRVLFLSDCPFIPNSLGKMTYYITRGLMERGYEVYNVCPAATTTLWSIATVYATCLSEHDPIVSAHARHDNSEADHVFVCYPWNGSLKPHIRSLDPDVILLFGTPYAPPLHEALRECYSLDRPCVGYFDNESLKVIPEYALHAANATFYASPTEFARRTIAEGLVYAGIPEDVVESRSRVIYHGVDVELYTRARPEPVFGDGVFTYGTFSKNHIRKNIAVLLQAYASLSREVIEKTRLFLALVGFGGGNEWKVELLTRYAEMLTGNRISDKIIGLDGFERDKGVTEYQVLRIYASMDVFVFPSEGESFGLPPVEAALMGKPVVVTRHPALEEIWGGLPDEVRVRAVPYVLPEAFGLVKPDPSHMARAMELLYEDERFRRLVARKAREIAMGFDWRKMVDGIARMIDEALELGPNPLSKSMKRR